MREALRSARGKTPQQDVAEFAGVARHTYSRIETGARNPSLPVAIRIAHFLQRPVEELFPELVPADPQSTAARRPQARNSRRTRVKSPA